MDGLDISDLYYDRKISDLQRRYDEQYGRIDEKNTKNYDRRGIEVAVNKSDIIKIDLSNIDMHSCIESAQVLCETMIDRSDLHLRSYMERYINILMGEVAELAVIKWLKQNGKYAVSAVNKKSGKPDLGYDIILKDKDGSEIKCSVKSSLSVWKSEIDEILNTFTVATKKSELREVNIQVYYWLKLKGENRITVPSNNNMAIIGWIGKYDVPKFGTYSTEKRQVADIKLKDIYSMESLLDYLS